MRRIIRKARNSEYFFRKLIFEIKKKVRNRNTILNDSLFSHLHDYFDEIYYADLLRQLDIMPNDLSVGGDKFVNLRNDKKLQVIDLISHSSSDTFSDSENSLKITGKKQEVRSTLQSFDRNLSEPKSIDYLNNMKTISFQNFQSDSSDF